ncbi:hypothetical protein [Herbaspirillum sp. SJZ107]|uniref:hypothetical protein n=1 Tax=Herbaspirillum sp. SJZ107 TaxID=2572881 RepID=UPI00114E276D|nr:hypothetical protein [Herbaspirillum sp. SJZ107]TQK10244.1 hypothetical protein FBX97_0160 [Herbaspirillum sp. SJZ107]
MKLAKHFQGVPDGKIYPVQYQPGDECPPELEAAAAELGALNADAPAPVDGGDQPTPPKSGRGSRAK